MRTISKLGVSVVLLFATSLLVGVKAWGQYENGSVVGTVRDSSGAPIPNAKVTVTNNATAITSKTKTNGEGDYDVPSLKVGGEATSVEVTGVALQVETETSQRDQTVTNYQSQAFPLVTRNYSDLLALIPGSREAPTQALTSSVNSLLRAGSFNVNGERSMFNNFLLDGMDNNAYGESNQGFDNQIIAIPPDSVAQFSVVTNNESAEYGRSSGATINVASAMRNEQNSCDVV